VAERRRVSLLDCAIAASAAIVPVFALAAVVRPAAPDGLDRQGGDDRYVSVRRVAALKTFERAVVRRSADAPLAVVAADVVAGVPMCSREWSGGSPTVRWLREVTGGGRADTSPAEQIALQLGELDAALLRFSTRTNPRVEHRVPVDAARWFAAAGVALATPVAVGEASGRNFQVRCADLIAALDSLRRADAAMLESLAWRGTEGSATIARWRDDQEMQITAREVTRKNPWGGVPGCIYLGGGDGAPATSRPAQRWQRLCARAEVRGPRRGRGGGCAPRRAR
jgi:hypothetical protein